MSATATATATALHSPGQGRITIPSRASKPQFPFWQQTWFIALLFAMAVGFLCLAVFLFLGLDLDTGYGATTPTAEGVEITYDSVLKLMHERTKFRLHSHDMSYGSGSGQQSVTAFPNVDDANSYWVRYSLQFVQFTYHAFRLVNK
ncbi:PREDICTED: stromal cell-derived factor 2-like protein-like [Fragaria vesca subsp. vesca]